MKNSYNPGNNRMSGFGNSSNGGMGRSSLLGGIGRNPRSSRMVLAALAAAGAMAWVNRNGGFSQVLNQVKDKARDMGLGGQQNGSSNSQQGTPASRDLGSQTGGATEFGGQAPQGGLGGTGMSGGTGGRAHTPAGADASDSLNAGIADESTIPDKLPSGTLA